MTAESDRTHLLRSRPTDREPLPARLRVEGAASRPRVFNLRAGVCIIGSGKDADLIVADPAVSRRHVELSLAPEGVLVSDLGSSNGTFYLGQRCERMVLGLGSRLRIGSSEIVIDSDLDALKTLPKGPAEYRSLVGESPVMQALFALLTRLEGSLAHVLIEGESGAGKELVARAIQEGSALAGRPFVSVNCGAIGRELILSELFGHKKGAFTGAVETRRGAFDEAHEGTLFLDEIGELPLDVQPALLRALELGEVRAVGESQPHKVRVRVLAATNRNLEEEAKAGRFRQDVYYRLAVVKLKLPPLRDRIGDVALLARRIAEGEGVVALPEDFVQSLEGRSWPGNVRELRNAIQSFLALGTSTLAPSVLDPLEAVLQKSVDPTAPYAEQKDAIVAAFTKVYVQGLLARTENQSQAAKIAGLDRGYFGRLAARYGGGRNG